MRGKNTAGSRYGDSWLKGAHYLLLKKRLHDLLKSFFLNFLVACEMLQLTVEVGELYSNKRKTSRRKDKETSPLCHKVEGARGRLATVHPATMRPVGALQMESSQGQNLPMPRVPKFAEVKDSN